MLCPYCNKQTDFRIYNFYFCSDCFKKWFGFSIEEYKKIKNKYEIHKKMLNNYKSNRPFIFYTKTKLWYKQAALHRDNDQPAVIWTDGSKFWYKNGKFIKEERK
jgi:hypothetical protein